MKKLKITYNAPVTLSFVIACFLVCVAGALTGGWSTWTFFSVYASSLDPLSCVRVFTHVLGHANFEHFVANAAYILLLGPLLEEKYGSKTMLLLIAATAVVTGAIHSLLFPFSALCGASGVVFAFIVLSSFTAFKEGEIPLSFILVAVVFLGGEIYSGLTALDNVSNLTHFIGGLVGGAAGYWLNKNEKKLN